MNTSIKKRVSLFKNKRASDPLYQLIFEKGLRVLHMILDRNLDLIVLILSNGIVVKSKVSNFPRLKKASVKHLNNWNLVSDGAGIEWPDLNEDLSLKGFIKSANTSKTLHALQGDQEGILT